MFCRTVRKKLKAYCDDELPQKSRKAVASHLRSCSACAAEAENLARAWESLQALAEPPAIPDLTQQVLQRIVQYEEQRAQPWYRCAIPLFRLSFAQAAVCAMIVGFFAGFVSSTFAPLPGLVQKTSDDELSGDLFSDLPSAFPGSAVVVMSYDEGDEES